MSSSFAKPEKPSLQSTNRSPSLRRIGTSQTPTAFGDLFLRIVLECDCSDDCWYHPDANHPHNPSVDNRMIYCEQYKFFTSNEVYATVTNVTIPTGHLFLRSRVTASPFPLENHHLGRAEKLCICVSNGLLNKIFLDHVFHSFVLKKETVRRNSQTTCPHLLE